MILVDEFSIIFECDRNVGLNGLQKTKFLHFVDRKTLDCILIQLI